ncbi:MarR family transcriptional regulator [Thalassospira sp. NFXS8]|uniref:MarR family winged helix-turn-helix transcriptional regulator n=1 Tax=unclassified Thalassospira TaxID=2648997 RepID=UPI0032DE2DA8
MTSKKSPEDITLADYRTLAEFRYVLRCFLDFSQKAAKNIGLTPRQHQALLAIKGFPEDRKVTIGDLAKRLLIRHHSAVELVNRLVEAGLVQREPSPDDNRQVILELTERANQDLAELSAAHLEELTRIRPLLGDFL